MPGGPLIRSQRNRELRGNALLSDAAELLNGSVIDPRAVSDLLSHNPVKTSLWGAIATRGAEAVERPARILGR